MLEPPVGKEEMKEIVLETLRRNSLRMPIFALLLPGVKSDLGLDPAKCPKQHCSVLQQEYRCTLRSCTKTALKL